MKTIQYILMLGLLFKFTDSEFGHGEELEEEKHGRRVRRNAEISTGYDLSIYIPQTVSYTTDTNVYNFPATHADDFPFTSSLSETMEPSGTLVDPFSSIIHNMDSQVTTVSFGNETTKAPGYTSIFDISVSSASDYFPLTSIENRTAATATLESNSLTNTYTSSPQVLDSPVSTLSVLPSISNAEVSVQSYSSFWTTTEIENMTSYMEDTQYMTGVIQLTSDIITEAFVISHSVVQSDINSSKISSGFMANSTPDVNTFMKDLDSKLNQMSSSDIFISTKLDLIKEVSNGAVISTSWISLETEIFISENLLSYSSWPSISMDSSILIHTDQGASSYSVLEITLTTQTTPELISSNDDKSILNTDFSGYPTDLPLTVSETSLSQDLQNSTFQPSEVLSLISKDTFSLSSEFLKYDTLYSFSLFGLQTTLSSLQDFVSPSGTVSISLESHIFSTISESSSVLSDVLNAGMLSSELSPSMQFSNLLIQSSVFVQDNELSRFLSGVSTSDTGQLPVYQTEYTLEDKLSYMHSREAILSREWTNTLSTVAECSSCSTILETTESQNQFYYETFSISSEVSQYDIFFTETALYQTVFEDTDVISSASSYTVNALLSLTPQSTFYLANNFTGPSSTTAVEHLSTFTEMQTVFYQSESLEQLGTNVSDSGFLPSTIYHQSDLTNVSLSASSSFESDVTHTDIPVFQENDSLIIYSSLNMFTLTTLTEIYLSEVKMTPHLSDSNSGTTLSLEINATNIVSLQELDTISTLSTSNPEVFSSETINFTIWSVSMSQSVGTDTVKESISTSYVAFSEEYETASPANVISFETMHSSSYFGSEIVTHHMETTDMTASVFTEVLNTDKIIASPTETTINIATDTSLMQSMYFISSANDSDYSFGIIPTETLQVLSLSDVITSILSFSEASVSYNDITTSLFQDLSVPTFSFSFSENSPQTFSQTVLQTLSYMTVDRSSGIFSKNVTEVSVVLNTASTAQPLESENLAITSDFILRETSILNPSSFSAFPESYLVSSIMQQNILASTQYMNTHLSLQPVETTSTKWLYESLSSSQESTIQLLTLSPLSYTFTTNYFLNLESSTSPHQSLFVITTLVTQSSISGNAEQKTNTTLTPQFSPSLESLTLLTYLVSGTLPTVTLPPSALQHLTSTAILLDTLSSSNNLLQVNTFIPVTSFSEFISLESVNKPFLSTRVLETFISVQVSSISFTTSTINVAQTTVLSSSNAQLLSSEVSFSFSSNKDNYVYPSMNKSTDNLVSSEQSLFMKTSAFVGEFTSFSRSHLEAELSTTFKVNATVPQTYMDATSEWYAGIQPPEVPTVTSINITSTTIQNPTVRIQETTLISLTTMVTQWSSSSYSSSSTVQTLTTHTTKQSVLQSTTDATTSSPQPGDTTSAMYTTTVQPQILAQNIVEMILRVNSSVDISGLAFRQSVINGIRNTILQALALQSRRKRRSTQDVITVYLQSVIRSAAEDVTVQFAVLKNGSALLASDTIAVLSKLPNFVEELAKNMNYQVVKAPYVAATNCSSSSSTSETGWIIAVVILAVACMVLLILLIFFVVKWYGKKSSSQREVENAGKERPMTSNALLKERKHGIMDLEEGVNERNTHSVPLILQYSESTKNISFAAQSGNAVLMRNNPNHTGSPNRNSDIQGQLTKKTDGNNSNDIQSQMISRQEHSLRTFSSHAENRKVTEEQKNDKEFLQGAEFEHVAQMNVSTQSPKAVSIPLRFKASIVPLPPLKSQRLTVQESDSETEDSADESLQTSHDQENDPNDTDQVLVPMTWAKPIDGELQRKSEIERKRNKERLREKQRESQRRRMEENKQQTEKEEDESNVRPKTSEEIDKMRKKIKKKKKELKAWKKAQAQIASLLDSQPIVFRNTGRNTQKRQPFPWRTSQVEEFKQSMQGVEMDYYDQGVIPPYASAPGWMLPSQLRSTPQQMPAQYITISHPLPYPWQAVPPPNTRHNAKFLRRIQGPVPQRAAVQDEESSSLGESSSVPGSILDESEYTGTGGADIPERSSSYIRATQTRAAGKERPSHPGLPLFNPGNQDYFQALTSLNSHSGASVPSKKTKKAKQNSDSENSNMMHSSEMIQKKMAVKNKAKI